MSINEIGSFIKPIEPLIKGRSPQGVEQAPKAKSSEFGEMLKSALKEVDDLQIEAERQIDGITTGKDGFTTHGAMIALEKADIAFQLMTTIRTKITRAYEEVIRTQI